MTVYILLVYHFLLVVNLCFSATENRDSSSTSVCGKIEKSLEDVESYEGVCGFVQLAALLAPNSKIKNGLTGVHLHARCVIITQRQQPNSPFSVHTAFSPSVDSTNICESNQAHIKALSGGNFIGNYSQGAIHFEVSGTYLLVNKDIKVYEICNNNHIQYEFENFSKIMIVTKNSHPPNGTIKHALEELEKKGLNTSHLATVDQDKCSDEYKRYCKVVS